MGNSAEVLLYRLNAGFLVHSEVNANELGFSGLSPKISFYKRIKWFKTFNDKINVSAKNVVKSIIIQPEIKFFMLYT